MDQPDFGELADNLADARRWNASLAATGTISFTVTFEDIGAYFNLMFGPAAIPPLPPEIMSWQEDGGAILPGEDGYTHLLAP